MLLGVIEYFYFRKGIQFFVTSTGAYYGAGEVAGNTA